MELTLKYNATVLKYICPDMPCSTDIYACRIVNKAICCFMCPVLQKCDSHRLCGACRKYKEVY